MVVQRVEIIDRERENEKFITLYLRPFIRYLLLPLIVFVWITVWMETPRVAVWVAGVVFVLGLFWKWIWRLIKRYIKKKRRRESRHHKKKRGRR